MSMSLQQPSGATLRQAWSEPEPRVREPHEPCAELRESVAGFPALPPSRLADDEVDLWIVPLPIAPEPESNLAVFLTPDELHRALRFGTVASRHRFVAGRGVLRLVLGRYLGVEPGELRFSVGKHGKPALVNARGLSFNISHTDGLLMLAVAAGMDIGVDVERVRPIDGALTMAARYFTARERAGMEDGPEAFLRLWTCRESAVKAAGTGISAGWEAVRLVERSRDEADAVGLAQDCHVRLVLPRPGYVAAVAALSPRFRIRGVETLDFPETFRTGATQ